MLKHGKKWLKIANNYKISKVTSFFWLETTSKIGTSHFHTMFGSREMHFMSFWGQNGPKMPKKRAKFRNFFFENIYF